MATNECTPSTTWEYRKVKISRRLQGSAGASAGGRPPKRLARRDPHERLSIVVKYRGGAEAWWLVEARGERYTFPGHLAMHDVLMFISDGNLGVAKGGRR